MDSIIVVGAGLAAAHAVETLRAEGYTGQLTLLGTEKELPYERPPLSKEVLLGDQTVDDTRVHDAGWYAERDVRLRLGVTVTRLDSDARRIDLDTGETLTYDALLLTTGAEPRVPDIPGADQAVYLRTVDDVPNVLPALEAGKRVVVVGGGWIGLELAAAARARGADATVLERGDLPLQKILGDRLARYLAELHLTHGVDLRTRVTVDEVVVTDGQVTGVRTGETTIDGDLVVVATGAVPNDQLAADAGLSVDDGIVVDDAFRTSAEGVWAAGDVARADHTRLGRLRVEHWDNAIKQGSAAARSILGQDVHHDWAPYFFTDQFEFSMEYVGHGSGDDDVEVRGDVDEHQFIAYWLDGDTVTAAMNVGIWDVNEKLRDLVGTTVDREQLTDLR
ncbi:hypothetical protein ASD11_12000 [Aeromicrobium sp. Root495]|uniref:NAD(P)/FAD-dependent oxidoreductase n=1 Tax=Aeromicrobium sp. Root495 TaxID=1736550 RepID=UPI0006FE3935|nr:FAD-dependent oxidoreductase [Aeromicrobium sp. Root495]KQY60188.1 hypothetical protein ASD11_12000 [Aeromicrobium sp. Root495]